MHLFELLTKEEKKTCTEVLAQKNQILFHENDLCQAVGIVLSGQINIVSYALSGQEIVYNQIKVGGIFGNNLLFSSNPYYKGNVIAATDTSLVLIKKEALLTILQNNQNFLMQYLQINADFSKHLNHQIKLLSFLNAEDRFFYYLQESHRVKFKSVTELAKTLFLTRETLSRLITKLVKEGKIVRQGNIIELLK